MISYSPGDLIKFHGIAYAECQKPKTFVMIERDSIGVILDFSMNFVDFTILTSEHGIVTVWDDWDFEKVVC